MRISPLDIRKQTFKGKMRGSDPEEVRVFLDVVATEFEQVLQENAMMAERLRAQEVRLTEFRALEEAMRNSLVTADRIASESRESSEREARRLVQDAHLRAERILEDARERLQSLIGEIEVLRGKKEVFARRFWTLLESQVGVVQEHLQDNGDVRSLRERIDRLQAEIGAAAAEHQAADRSVERASAVPPGFDPRAGGPRAIDPRTLDPRLASRDETMRTPESWAEPVPMETSPSPRPATPDPLPVARTSSPSPWSRDLSPSRAAEDDWGHAAAPAPESGPARDPGRGHGLGLGLKNLLHRGRQEQLPLEGTGSEGDLAGGEAWGEAPSPTPERREGFFEFKAGEGTRDNALARFRGGPPPDRS